MELRDEHNVSKQEMSLAFAAIAHYLNSSLTASVYCMECHTPEQAESKAYEYFTLLSKKAIHHIDVLPQGSRRWDSISPVYTRFYLKQN